MLRFIQNQWEDDLEVCQWHNKAFAVDAKSRAAEKRRYHVDD